MAGDSGSPGRRLRALRILWMAGRGRTLRGRPEIRSKRCNNSGLLGIGLLMEKRLSSGVTVESESIDALYAAQQRQLVRMAALLVGRADLAEEIVQEAFVVVGDRWASLDRPGAYLRRVVINGCWQARRRAGVEVRYLEAVPRDLVEEMPVRLIELRAALDTLNERHRAVIVLRYFVDLPDIEIAELLGVEHSSVRSIAHRALHRLRKELE